MKVRDRKNGNRWMAFRTGEAHGVHAVGAVWGHARGLWVRRGDRAWGGHAWVLGYAGLCVQGASAGRRRWCAWVGHGCEWGRAYRV